VKRLVADNVFDDADGRFHVLLNDEGQYSLWPVFLRIPGGWTVMLEDSDRQSALEYVEKAWTDMRPASLADELDAQAPADSPRRGLGGSM
jgi:MbtH protein